MFFCKSAGMWCSNCCTNESLLETNSTATQRPPEIKSLSVWTQLYSLVHVIPKKKVETFQLMSPILFKPPQPSGSILVYNANYLQSNRFVMDKISPTHCFSLSVPRFTLKYIRLQKWNGPEHRFMKNQGNLSILFQSNTYQRLFNGYFFSKAT